MFEKALHGSRGYWIWVGALALFVTGSFLVYVYQYREGLWITGLSRDVSWGLYISQFTFLVGVAASAVVLVLPFYLHNVEVFSRAALLAQFLAIGAVVMSLLFIVTDLGKPMRLFNVPLHPTLHSMLFWDMIFLNGYLVLNLVTAWSILSAHDQDVAPPRWVKPFIYVSIPWAVLMHMITAFIYAGTPGREFWLTAIMTPRFLASAFAAGPILLIILGTLIEKMTGCSLGRQAIQKLVTIALYMLILDLFFIGLEFFTAFYSHIPAHTVTFRYLLLGLHGNDALRPWYWAMLLATLSTVVLFFIPVTRKKPTILLIASIIGFIGLWIDKGFVLVVAAFIPNPFGEITEYPPTGREILITLGIYAVGAIIITLLYKIVVGIEKKREGRE
jgi:Ni/Fe-hydrogenase subunit HybB-like protein